jgi:phage baseplate assembly protein W
MTINTTGSPNILSDKSVGENYNKSKIVARKKPWADLDLSLKLHPIRKDIMPLRDDLAIRNAVRNLVLTNFFERPFQPRLGADLIGLLFEPNNLFTRNAIKSAITNVLIRNEPRVQLLTVEVKSKDNDYEITISYRIKEFNVVDTARVTLERIR